MLFSESYQVRENIKTSRFINRVFVSFGILFLICLACYIGFDLVTVNGIYLVFGFGFDIASALPTFIIPLIVIRGDERLNRRVLQHLQKFSNNKILAMTPIIFRDVEGKTVYVETELVTQTYFKQLENAWNS